MTKREEIMVGFTTWKKENLLCVFLCFQAKTDTSVYYAGQLKQTLKKKKQKPFHYPRLENPEDRIWDNDGNQKMRIEIMEKDREDQNSLYNLFSNLCVSTELHMHCIESRQPSEAKKNEVRFYLFIFKERERERNIHWLSLA